MNKEWKDKWIAALQSGTYQQGSGRLRTRDDEYCCLGVLCDVVSPTEGTWETREEGGVWVFSTPRDSSSAYLPDSLATKLELSGFAQERLAMLNDSLVPFATVAALLADDAQWTDYLNSELTWTTRMRNLLQWATERGLSMGNLQPQDDAK